MSLWKQRSLQNIAVMRPVKVAKIGVALDVLPEADPREPPEFKFTLRAARAEASP
jgi:hypothetical protein